jgi:TBC1 domain family member 13
VIADQIARALEHPVRGSRSLPEGLLAEALSATEFREHVFRECLASAEIDCDELRRIVWAHGVPDRPWARPVAWKLLLGYLPPERVEWDNVLRAKRAHYWELVAQLTVDPSMANPAGDHPLSADSGSRWAEYFRDKDLREVIEKDVVRTHADLHRFLPLRDSLSRILFVYSKDNPTGSDGYRQGMNEMVAPLLLVFADAPFVHVSDAEADAFFCFQIIMKEMERVYAVKETEFMGIGRQLKELQALLRIKDPRLEAHLAQIGVDPRFYALRWIRVWLTREFDVPEALRVWDSLLAADIRLPWLRYICVAMLIRIRALLLVQDFSGCMKLLLHYPPCDIADLLRVADRLRIANVTIVRAELR